MEHFCVHVVCQRVERGNQQTCEDADGEEHIRTVILQQIFRGHGLLEDQLGAADDQTAHGRSQQPQKRGRGEAILEHLLAEGAEEADEEAVDRAVDHGGDDGRQTHEGQLDAGDLNGSPGQAKVECNEDGIDCDACDGETGAFGHKKILLKEMEEVENMHDAMPRMTGTSCSGGCGNSIAETQISFARRQPPIRPVLNALFLLPAAS